MARSITPSNNQPPRGPFLRKDMDFLTGLMTKRRNSEVTKATTSALGSKFQRQFVGLVNSPNPAMVERAKGQLSAARDVIGTMNSGEAKLQLDRMVNKLEKWIHNTQARHASGSAR